MNRRTFLIGAGSVAAGSAAAMGTGAFTSVSAKRTVNVDTAADNDAFLKLDPSGSTNNAYASNAGNGTVQLNLNGSADGSGSGLNDDALTRIFDIFTIKNHGTQPVVVYVEPGSIPEWARTTTNNGFGLDPQATNAPYAEDFSNDKPASNRGANLKGEFSLTGLYNGPVAYGVENFVLEVGDSFDFGLYVDTGFGETPDEVSLDLQLTADSTLVPDSYGTGQTGGGGTGGGDETTSDGTDADGDGYTIDEGDCNDNDPDVYPGAKEVADGKDNDCDGTVDEGFSS